MGFGRIAEFVTNPWCFSLSNLCIIFSFRVCVGSCCSLLYTSGLLRCALTFMIYCCLFSTTTVLPLSALLMTR